MEEVETYDKKLLDSHSKGFEMTEVEKFRQELTFEENHLELPEIFKIGGCLPRISLSMKSIRRSTSKGKTRCRLFASTLSFSVNIYARVMSCRGRMMWLP